MSERKSYRAIAKKMLEMVGENSQYSDNEVNGLSKKLKSFIEGTYKYFSAQDIDINHISQKTYECIMNTMLEMTKNYSLTNIEDWIKEKEKRKVPARLYYCESCDTIQFDFYDDIRNLMYRIIKIENCGKIDYKSLHKIESTQKFYQQIGAYLNSYYRTEFEKPQSKAERSISSFAELKDILKKLKKEEKEGAYSKTNIQVLNEILDTAGKLFEIYNEDTQKNGTSIRNLEKEVDFYQKKRMHALVSNNKNNYLADYLKISIEENSNRMLLGQSEEIQNLFERGCRIYQKKKEKLLNDIVNELLNEEI